MGWSVGFDSEWERDIGYGVPSICDHPECNTEINRGLSYVCGADVYGGEIGCGLFFCLEHQMDNYQRCERCLEHQHSFDKKPDVQEWKTWKKEDES